MPPLLEYELLLSAYGARQRGEYRTTLIDAAIALEVCLSSCIDDELEQQRVAWGKSAKSKYTTLGGLVEFANAIGLLDGAEKIQKKVVGPRNRAVHHREITSRGTAGLALSTVRDTLAKLRPLFQAEPG